MHDIEPVIHPGFVEYAYPDSQKNPPKFVTRLPTAEQRTILANLFYPQWGQSDAEWMRDVKVAGSEQMISMYNNATPSKFAYRAIPSSTSIDHLTFRLLLDFTGDWQSRIMPVE